MTTPDPDVRSRELATEALAAGDPTGWFERLYAEAEDGTAVVPWDRGGPQRFLVAWAEEHGLAGPGRAMVVGSGLGDDAEFIAGFGYDTVAFDVSASAVAAARRRFPDSSVRYLAADLFDPPAEWHHAFDLVVESLTVQALPNSLRSGAIAQVGRLVAAGGRLLVIAAGRAAADEPQEGPPWPLTRAEIDSFAADGLEPVRIEELRSPGALRWRAEFHRPQS